MYLRSLCSWKGGVCRLSAFLAPTQYPHRLISLYGLRKPLTSTRCDNRCYSDYPTNNAKRSRSKKFFPEYKKGVNVGTIMQGSDWMLIDQFRVCPWTLSGLESCVLVESDDLSVAFDMGYAYRDTVKCGNIFISHGHHDHVAGIVHHAQKRNLYGMKPAKYHVPPNLVEPLMSIAKNFAQMNENDATLANMNFKPVSVDETIKVTGSWTVKPFPTKHRVPSQGYLIYKHKKTLKPEFQGRDGSEIGGLVRQGVDVHDTQTIPLVAYTGDTMFDIFKAPHNPDLLKVKLLITETTYIDDEVDKQGRGGVERARSRGHCHLQEFVDNRELFDGVKNILFVHFSDKYSLGYIKARARKIIPEDMREKVHLGLLLKEKCN